MKAIIKATLILYFIFSISYLSIGQISINDDGASPDASAMLDVTSSSKGILIPRMTTAERTAISSPATGLLVYDTDESSFWYYANAAWSKVGGSGFVSENDITHSNNNDDDFAFGADSLNYGSGTENKFFFDKSKGAFRIGGVVGTNWDESNIGNYSIGLGFNSIASGTNAASFGFLSTASGDYSTSFGNNTTASGIYGVSFGLNTISSGSGTTSFGSNTTASGDNSTSFGLNTTASGNLSIVTGLYTEAFSFGETVIGFYNTTYTPNNTAGFDTDDRLFVIGNGVGVDSSNRSDAMIVYKNGNTEINGNLTVSGSLTGSNTAFVSENDITHSNNNDDDFVFGADSLNYGSGTEAKLFLDKSLGAFRVGTITGTNWDESNIGDYSIGLGYNTTASGRYSTSLGYNATSSGNYSTSFGRSTVASGDYSTSFGLQTGAAGNISTSFGVLTEAPSYAEVAIGTYNTTYTPNSVIVISKSDRAFVIGNGISTSSRSDAMIVYKNGNTKINGALTLDGAFTFPTADGTASQTLITDGSGTLSWSDISFDALMDADSDTKIQVEESSNEDIIRFDLGGTEFMRLDSGRIEIVNTGNSVFLGEGAGESDNYSDNRNTFIGGDAGAATTTGYRNVYLGYKSGVVATTAYFNTFLGFRTGFSNTTGHSNTIIGYDAGLSNTTGSSNVFLGYNAGYSETNSNRLYIENSNSSSPLIYGEFDNDLLVFNGEVGIGVSPTKAMLEVDGSGTTQSFNSAHGYLTSSGASTTSSTTTELSIYASSSIAAESFIAFSDARIKNIQSVSNSKKDLNTLMNIEITDYTMKDTISKGNQSIKKVIAQQVAAVYPQAVRANLTDVIPNIYKKATIQNGWVELATDLQVGEKVQLVFQDKKEILEVLEIKENTFRVDSKFKNHHSKLEPVFVYGRQVTDFHTVDYEAISMLNVSATQELIKIIEKQNDKVEAQQTEIETLKVQLEKVNQMEVLLQELQAQLENQ